MLNIDFFFPGKKKCIIQGRFLSFTTLKQKERKKQEREERRGERRKKEKQARIVNQNRQKH